MSSLSELYQNVILEHNRSPRNYRAMDGADAKAEGHNPLCGDQLTVWLRLDGDVVRDVSFLTIFRGVIPFVITDLLRLTILIALPILATFLPARM